MTPYAQQLDQLIDGNLDNTSFRHINHIGVAFEALKREGFFDALATVANGIIQAANQAGAPEKFNATITMAFMSEIAERMEVAEYADADAFIAANPDLISGGILKRFSNGRAFSARARRIALLPDLAVT